MIVLARIALASAVVALGAGAYLFFAHDNPAGIVAMAIAGAVAALAASLAAQAKKKDRDDAG